MSGWTDERLQRIVHAYETLGDEIAVAKQENIKYSSVDRMLRAARERGIMLDPDNPEGEIPRNPNILLLDIETSLMQFFGWAPGKQWVGPEQIVQDWHMLGWAAKWLFEVETYSEILTVKEAKEHTDKRITESLWKFMDKADIIIAHNALGFDIPKIMNRVISHGLPPITPYQIIDTLKNARSSAIFSSNKQDELCKKFGLRRKVEHEGYKLWIKCFYGDGEALKTMQEYNEGDVLGLEDLYLYMRPYYRSHPNIALYMDNKNDSCYKCGSENIKWLYEENGDPKCYYTNVNKFHTYRCTECNSIGRSRHSILNKEQKKVITNPIAR